MDEGWSCFEIPIFIPLHKQRSIFSQNLWVRVQTGTGTHSPKAWPDIWPQSTGRDRGKYLEPNSFLWKQHRCYPTVTRYLKLKDLKKFYMVMEVNLCSSSPFYWETWKGETCRVCQNCCMWKKICFWNIFPYAAHRHSNWTGIKTIATNGYLMG